MRLAVGTRFGPYVIESALGAGGMGEVYKARDTKLGRSVAIKVLPHDLTADPERLARFEREGRLLASLNHPHIGGIYGLEEGDGGSALVLELIDGQTLAARLTSREHLGEVLPLDETVAIARQIADALDAAHERGIIHRDLKPANVMVTPTGAVKVLDFGLAKATGPADSDISEAQPTTVVGTREGIVLGTAAYMSPEQARGLGVDKRTDIWAFGCVLYEMLTGRRAFSGTTMTDVLAAILAREPDWSALPETTPLSIRRVLRRCLQKDLRRRLQHIGDARVELEDTFASEESAAIGARTIVDRRSATLPWAIAAIASLIAVITVTWYAQRERQPSAAPARVTRLMLPTSGAATPSGPVAMTPDGSRIVYAGNNGTQLFVRSLDQLEPAAIFTAAAPLNDVTVSPDGQWVWFLEGNSLKQVASTGGPATVFVPSIAGGGVTWGPDQTIIFDDRNPAVGLRRISTAGGTITDLTRPDAARGELDHRWPEMLPGGRSVLFTITSATGGIGAAQLAVFDLATNTQKVLVRGGSHPHYVSSGHLVYASEGGLKAIGFDPERLETRGTPTIVISRLMGRDFSVSNDGTLVYTDAPDAAVGRTLVWVDRRGQEEPLPAPPRAYSQPRVSPDGRRVAASIDGDIWMWDVARKVLDRRTFDPANDFFPLWSPLGDRLLFTSQQPTGPTLFWQAADGSGATEPLTGEVQSDAAVETWLPTGVTRDGRQVIIYFGGTFDVMLLPLDGKRIVRPLVQTAATENNGTLSPDNRWLAYASDSSQRIEVYVRPFPNVDAGQSQVSVGGGMRPVWAPNGQELFYEAPGGAIMAVRIDGGSRTWSAGAPAKVVSGSYLTAGGGIRNFDVSPDGQRFLMVKPSAADILSIVVVQHWTEDLKRLVP